MTAQATEDIAALPRVLDFAQMTPRQLDLLAIWGTGASVWPGADARAVTWGTLKQSERDAIRDEWTRGQFAERK
jgi:hypothetical protein